METLTVSDFRNNLAESFSRVSNGENVLIRRKNEIYALVKIGNEDLSLSPELQKRIDDVHQAFKSGDYTACSTPKELDSFLNSL
jgi:hypothetical protein